MASQLLMNTTFGGVMDIHHSAVPILMPWAACPSILAWMMLPFASIILYCVYELYFHPLAKYPGPLLAKFTILRATYHAWKEDIHLDMFHCHQKYGPIVRYAPDFVLFDTPSAIKDIYGTKSNTWKHHNFATLSPKSVNLFTAHDKKEHAKRRRLVGPSFSDNNMQRFEKNLIHHCQTLCEQLYPSRERHERTDSWGPAMNMSDWCRYLAFDVISEFLFGITGNLLQSNEWRHMEHSVADHSRRNAVLLWLPILMVGRLDKILYKDAVEGTKKLWQWIQYAVERSAACNATESLFSRLTGAKDKETGTSLTDEQIRSELGVAVVAGMDTTASAISALLFYLSRNKQIYDRLTAEIRGAFGSIDEIRHGKQLKSCTYLHACIEETLRMTPPVGSSTWREVGPGGENVDGHFIPKGCCVGTSIYSIHHNEAYFSKPHEFIPERWLPDSDILATKSACLAFSSGSRSCIGRPLAYSEFQLTVTLLIWTHDFRAVPGTRGKLGGGRMPHQGESPVGRANPNEFQLQERIISVSEGPLLQFRPRKLQ
ncbi:Cytochrome P450 monooxygenase AKT7 [Cladobotryum mycophilum]|uniref:Cytochrome P450 monooxygenase AKT7 n=1 Tax=Cladobotryum mycophilum TaxID=491253 RepID=A0ABR0S7Y5_9HYPO